jgi:hypothetical protein
LDDGGKIAGMLIFSILSPMIKVLSVTMKCHLLGLMTNQKLEIKRRKMNGEEGNHKEEVGGKKNHC